MIKRFIAAAIVVVVSIPVTANAMQIEVKNQQSERTPVWKQHRFQVRWEARVKFRLAQKAAAEEAAREAAAAAEAAAEEEAEQEVSVSYPSGGSGGSLSASQVASLARGAGFPEHLISTMVSIAWRESRYNPGAINPSSGACGLWQMYPCPGSHALDPATNAQMAYSKYVGAGHSLSPWGY